MKNLSIVFVFASLVGCNDLLQSSSDGKVCPIEFTVDSANNYTLHRTWYLVGLKTAAMRRFEYPPCGLSEDNSVVTLSFDSVAHGYDVTSYPLPFLLGGTGPLNSYNGCYLTNNESLAVADIISTLVGGPDELVAFEKKYLNALSHSTAFSIEHNILTIYFEYKGNPGHATFVAKDN